MLFDFVKLSVTLVGLSKRYKFDVLVDKSVVKLPKSMRRIQYFYIDW